MSAVPRRLWKVEAVAGLLRRTSRGASAAPVRRGSVEVSYVLSGGGFYFMCLFKCSLFQREGGPQGCGELGW